MSNFVNANDDALKSGDPSLPFGDATLTQPENDYDALSTSSLGASNSSPRRAEGTDRYGFYISDETRTTVALSEQEMRFRKQKESERTKKWLKMIGNWERTLSIRKEKLKRRLRKGVPDSLRAQVWSKLCESWRYKKKFEELADHDPEALPIPVQTIEDIEKDIDRTFPTHYLFDSASPRGAEGQAALRRLLQRYALFDEDVGYCQGMAFIAALFITYMAEEEAFCCFMAALKGPKYHLRDLYLPDMRQAQKVLHVFGELGKQHLGALWRHLVNEGVHPSMYATEWLLTMFCRGFSFELVSRVWDTFLYEGYKIVYRVALALIKALDGRLRTAPFEEVLSTLRSISQIVDADRVMQMAFSIPLKRSQIAVYEAQFNKSHAAR